MMETPPFQRFTRLENFGHSLSTPAYRFQPQSTGEILDVFTLAKINGLTITLRGAGKSYNDASLNGGGIVLDMQQMNRVLSWDAGSGSVTVEPGVTLCQLWHKVLPDGWWPPVVSGTMSTTLGGCLSANIHGKNNFRMGTIGEHVTEFKALLPTGAEITCSPKRNGDLFRAMIGGLGMLGVFTSITLQMRRIHSGDLKVRAWSVPDLKSHLDEITRSAPEHNYTVGWLDTTARGRNLGRGQLHTADYLEEGEDPEARRTLRTDYQTLPAKFFGVVPKSLLHYFMAPCMITPGVRGVNTAKYLLARREKSFHQSHTAFHFLLDYIPNWELAYGNGGLIQYQPFLPKETASNALSEILTLSHRRGLPSYLGVTKRHRPDSFLLSHSLDGFSLAMDFKVTDGNRDGLSRMLQDFDRIVLDAGGRFYFVKNSETSAECARRFLGEETMSKFRALKNRCDPDHLLESDLFRRVFGRDG